MRLICLDGLEGGLMTFVVACSKDDAVDNAFV